MKSIGAVQPRLNSGLVRAVWRGLVPSGRFRETTQGSGVQIAESLSPKPFEHCREKPAS